MAVFTRIRKVANPQRRKVAVKRRARITRNASGQFVRRKKAKAKRATVKRKRKIVARRAVRRNPVRRRRAVKAVRRKVVRRKPAHKARKRRNPALLVTLGAVNPQPKRKVKVARRTKKSKKNPVHRRRRSRNATRIVVMAPRRRASVRRRRSNPKRRVSYRRTAKRNPSVFGSRLGSGQTLSMIAGGLAGVTVAKVLPSMLPASLIASPIARILATGASAWVASLLAGKVFSGPFSDAVFFGGLMQTGSMALNAFVPSIGARVGLNGGMGDLVPGTFPVPQNPIKGYVPPAPPTQARTSMNGLSRAFGPSFGA